VTAPASGRDDATMRGAVVLIVAIVIGLALLIRSGGGDDSADKTTTTRASSSTASTESTVPGDTLAPVDNGTATSMPGAADTRPPGDVNVLTLNGTTNNVAGAAGDNDTKIAAAGYATLDPSDAVEDYETTTIFATTEFTADAEAVRGLLGLPDAVIEVKPEDSLGPGSDEADIVVVVGDDIAPE